MRNGLKLSGRLVGGCNMIRHSRSSRPSSVFLLHWTRWCGGRGGAGNTNVRCRYVHLPAPKRVSRQQRFATPCFAQLYRALTFSWWSCGTSCEGVFFVFFALCSRNRVVAALEMCSMKSNDRRLRS